MPYKIQWPVFCNVTVMAFLFPLAYSSTSNFVPATSPQQLRPSNFVLATSSQQLRPSNFVLYNIYIYIYIMYILYCMCIYIYIYTAVYI